MQHTVRRSHHRIVHHDITARFHDLYVGDLTVGFNANLESANEGFRRVEKGSRLIPLAVKAIMDELVIPAELRGIAASSGPGSGSAGLSSARSRRLGGLAIRRSGGLG